MAALRHVYIRSGSRSSVRSLAVGMLGTPEVLLDAQDDVEDEPGEDDGDHGGPDGAGADCETGGGRQPDASRRCQPLDLMLGTELQDGASADEADACRDSLDHAA